MPREKISELKEAIEAAPEMTAEHRERILELVESLGQEVDTVAEDSSGKAAKQRIAHTPHGGYFPPTRPREPFGKHTFQGANVSGPEMLAAAFPDFNMEATSVSNE